jgi:hypothetical protein
MAVGGLPEDGELRLGPVSMPAGKLIHAGYVAPRPVAWVTRQAVPGPGRVWAASSRARCSYGPTRGAWSRMSPSSVSRLCWLAITR